MEDLFGFSDFRRSAPRPLLMAVALVAIAALGLSGLYQGFRMTWRDYGPAPSYPQIAAAPAPVVPAPDPVAADAATDTTPARTEVATNDVSPPLADPAPAAPPPATDAAALAPAAIAPASVPDQLRR